MNSDSVLSRRRDWRLSMRHMATFVVRLFTLILLASGLLAMSLASEQNASSAAAITYVDLSSSLGKAAHSPEIEALVSKIGASPKISKYDDCYFYNFKSQGISLRFEKATGTLSAIFLYPEYEGGLLFGLTFHSTRSEVESLLGPPDPSGGNGVIDQWTNYPSKGLYLMDGKRRDDLNVHISQLALTPVPAVPKAPNAGSADLISQSDLTKADAKDKPAAVITYGELSSALGKATGSPQVRALLSRLGASPKPQGILLRFDATDTLSAVSLYSEGVERFRQYEGDLPFGLSFQSTRRDVESLLGLPDSYGSSWAAYDSKGLTINYNGRSVYDPKLRLSVLTLRSPASLSNTENSAVQVSTEKTLEPAFEMPGMFRISLPSGWQRLPVTSDPRVVAAFSSKDLKLEIIHDLDKAPAEEFARIIAKPGLGTKFNGRLDEYSWWGGLPAQEAHYLRECATAVQAQGSGSQQCSESVWTLFTLSPGEYWALELSGHFPYYAFVNGGERNALYYALGHIVDSFRLLQPALSRVQTAIPEEAWKRVPRGCVGISTGIGWSTGSCGTWAPVSRDERPAPQNASALTLIADEAFDDVQFETGRGASQKLILQHYVGNLSADEFTEYVQRKLQIEKRFSYSRGNGGRVMVDGIPATAINSTRTRKKDRAPQTLATLTVSKGVDHFVVIYGFVPAPCDDPDLEACHADPNYDELSFSDFRLFGLHPAITAVSGAPRESASLPPEVALQQRMNVIRSKFLAATSLGDVAWAKALLEENPDLLLARNVRAGGMTPLHIVASDGNTELLKLLLTHHADVNAKNNDGWTPLHSAASSGKKDSVQLLLAGKADVNANSSSGETPLWQAAQGGHTEVAELLLAHGADINNEDNDGSTPLYMAARNRDIGIVKLLIAHNADVNRGGGGWAPLNMAAVKGYKDVAEVLLAHKADVNNKIMKNGMTPLADAASYGYKDLVELLIAHNADVNAKDNDGDTPLHCAAFFGYGEVVKLLLAHNADVNARGDSGVTPLSHAVIKGRKDVAEVLLAHEADVNAKDIYGNTALHLADSVDIAELLITHGADVNATNRNGFTPLALAKAKHDEDLARLLRQHGGHA